MILLDTHVLLWYTKGLAELGVSARALADEALSQDRLAVSAITFWEVEMLVVRGRLMLLQSTAIWRQDMLDQSLIELPVTGDLGIMAVRVFF